MLGCAAGAAAAFITKHVLRSPHAYAEVVVVLCVPYLAFIAADALTLSG